MTVRSTRLGAIHDASSGWWTLYISPNGWRTIVKDMRWDNAGQAATTIVVIAGNQAGTTQINLVHDAMEGNSIGSWTGWLVMDPGDYLSINSSTTGFSAWFSGTQLQLTGAEPTEVSTLPAGPSASPIPPAGLIS
jgi:hypothetical protein